MSKMLKLGIDLGNGYTKFKGVAFASKTKVGRLASMAGLGEKPDDIHEVGYKGTTYIVGAGEPFTAPDRYFTTDYDLCLLTAIALNSDDIAIDTEVCVGLPITHFMDVALRHRLAEHIMDLSKNEPAKLTLNGQDKLIRIKRVLVFAEGAYVMHTMDADNVITIDLGAGTINITQWDGMTPVAYDTVPKSFNKLYREIANHIKNTNRGTVTPAHVEKYFGKDEIEINGKMVNIKDTHEMIRKYVTGLVSTVFDICEVAEAKKIQVLGGGAEATRDYWKDAFGEARAGVEVLDRSQFTNSEIYQAVIERVKK